MREEVREVEVVPRENEIQIAMKERKDKEYCSQETIFPLFIISFLPIIYFIFIIFHFYTIIPNFFTGFLFFLLAWGFYLYFIG